VKEYSSVQYLPFNVTDEDCISNVLTHIDIIIQYADTREPKDKAMDEAEAHLNEPDMTGISDLHI
jgi:hypothetical protein